MADGLSDSDSRTFAVGRKRELQDISQYPEASATGFQSSDEEASRLGNHKRQKGSDKESDLSVRGDVLIGDLLQTPLAAGQATPPEYSEVLKSPESASSCKGPTKSTNKDEQEALKNSTLGVDNIGISEDASKLHLLRTYEDPPLAQGNPQAVGWNRGVQPGLRTSFGKKKQIFKVMDQQVPTISDASTLSRSAKHDNGGEMDKSASDDIESDKPQKGDSRATKTHEAKFLRTLNFNTTKVEAVLLREKVWPLPHRYLALNQLVDDGNTLYPTKNTNFSQLYEFKGTTEGAAISLMLNEEGLPYKVTDFSFDIWILQFLKMNMEKLQNIRSMSFGHIRSQFQAYFRTWYKHLKDFKMRSREASKSADDMALERALAIVTANRPGTVNHRKASLQKGIESPVMTQSFHKDQQRMQSSSNRQNVPHSSRKTDEVAESRKPRVLNNTPSTEPALNTNNSSSITRVAAVTGPSPVNPVPVTDEKSSSSKSSDEDIDMGNVSLRSRASTSAHDTEIDSVVEMAMQRKYFPGDSMVNSIHRCLACGDSGHWHNECAALDCSVCGEKGRHSNFTCPKNQPCGKCSQRGHASSYCPEKLRATKADMGACTICSDRNHLDLECHFLWRSFAPRLEDIRTVASIPVHCYTCGATGHYGPECGLHSGRLLTGGYTWSKLNIEKYVDVCSQARAVSAGIDYEPKKSLSKDFSIKGKGRASDPFTIDDSDGDEGFIRPRVNPATVQRGHIHVTPASQNLPRNYDERPYPRRNQGYQNDNMQYNVALNRGNYDMDYNYQGERHRSNAEYPAFARSENLAPPETRKRNSDEAPYKSKQIKGGPDAGAPKAKKHKKAMPAFNKPPPKSKKARKREAKRIPTSAKFLTMG
jgi:protein AIR1/2